MGSRNSRNEPSCILIGMAIPPQPPPVNHLRILGLTANVIAVVIPFGLTLISQSLKVGLVNGFLPAFIAIVFGALLHAAADNREAIYGLEVRIVSANEKLDDRKEGSTEP